MTEKKNNKTRPAVERDNRIGQYKERSGSDRSGKTKKKDCAAGSSLAQTRGAAKIAAPRVIGVTPQHVGRIGAGRIRELRDERAAPVKTEGRKLLEELRASGFIGIWKDRKDIGDSSEYARTLREGIESRADRYDGEAVATRPRP